MRLQLPGGRDFSLAARPFSYHYGPVFGSAAAARGGRALLLPPFHLFNASAAQLSETTEFPGHCNGLDTFLHRCSGSIDLHQGSDGLLHRSAGSMDLHQGPDALLHRCAASLDLHKGRLVHFLLVASSGPTPEHTLLHMYCKCGALEDALATLGHIHIRPAPLWNLVIGACTRLGHHGDALQHFSYMQSQGVLPDKITFAGIISTCTHKSAVAEGKRLHAQVEGTEFISEAVVGTALVKMYGKCGSLIDARKVFDHTDYRDLVSWTVLINAYVQRGKNNSAIEIYELMQHNEVVPGKVTFVSILSACTTREVLAVGKAIHAYIRKLGYESDTTVGNALVTMYGKCGSLEQSQCMFNSMSEQDVISWNAMIAVYAQNGDGKGALLLFPRMLQECVLPDEITFVSVLDACATEVSLIGGKQLHSNIMSRMFEPNIILENALINFYVKCGCWDTARNVFDEMIEHDETTWNVLISGLAKSGQDREALSFFGHMLKEGVMPNRITYVSIMSACTNQAMLAKGKQVHASIMACDFRSDVMVGTSMISMYGKCNKLDDARTVFYDLPDRNIVTWTAMIAACAQNGHPEESYALFNLVSDKQDLVLWNSIIAAFAQNGHGEEALVLFNQMLHEGILPDRITFISVLDAAASQAVVADGKRVHCRVVGSAHENGLIAKNALISMYGRCGSLEDAWSLFTEMQYPNVFSWSSMISSFAQIGSGKEALHIFGQMKQEGVIPDGVTFVNVLSACSHEGLICVGYNQFVAMKKEFSLVPTVDHYNCMVDLFGRSGRLDEAEDIIHKMPVRPTIVSWLTLLGACRTNLDVTRGERAAESVFQLDPDSATPYLILLSMYTASGRREDAVNVMRSMEQKGLKVDTDFSSFDAQEDGIFR